MRTCSASVVMAAVSVLWVSSTASAQSEANQFDSRDFSGIWRMVRGGGQYGPPGPPELTSAGIEAMRGRIPSRSVDDPSLANDPEYECNPAGFPKLLFDAEPIEMMQLPDRLLQVFQWEGRLRYIWVDGRDVPSGENLENLGPAWYGHSVAEWEGDTLVVNTVGLEERAWLQRAGHPKSFHARIEERYRFIDADTFEVQITLYDSEYYTAPWVSEPKIFERLPESDYTFFGWSGLFSGVTESICAPMDEVQTYNERFRDPSSISRTR